MDFALKECETWWMMWDGKVRCERCNFSKFWSRALFPTSLLLQPEAILACSFKDEWGSPRFSGQSFSFEMVGKYTCVHLRHCKSQRPLCLIFLW